jgi:hypothetical protein
MCYSEDCTRLAIFRKDKDTVAKGSKAPKEKFVIDIFDTSKIDFFMDESILNTEDPRHLMTIVDDDLPKGSKVEESVIKFCPNGKYITVLQQKNKLFFYDTDHCDASK